MKKSLVLCATVCVALAFTGCKPSENAYRKAYERAQAADKQQAVSTEQTAAPVVTLLEEKPATETTVVDNSDNTPVRQETVNVVSGTPLKAYSVVVGSFGLRANADGLANRLKSAGYDSRIAYNAERNTYRVVATSFDSKSSAIQSRNQLRSQYADAWLLFSK